MDGSVTSAAVRCDGSVVAEPCLRGRIEVLAAMGDRLTNGCPATTGQDPLTTTLVVIRAFDAVHSVILEEGPDGFALGFEEGLS